MKLLQLIILAISVGASITQAQSISSDSVTCPKGQSWYWGMATSGCIMYSGCYAPEEAQRLYRFINKCACEETSMGIVEYSDDSTAVSYSDSHVWSDSLGCVSTEKWEYLWRGRWVDINKSQYDLFRKGFQTKEGKL